MVATQSAYPLTQLNTRPGAAAHPVSAATLTCVLAINPHTVQGYGLAWSPFLEGNLLSGSDDAQICLWDIAGGKGAGRMDAKSIYHEHAGVVEVRVSSFHQLRVHGTELSQLSCLLTVATSKGCASWTPGWVVRSREKGSVVCWVESSRNLAILRCWCLCLADRQKWPAVGLYACLC